MFPLDIWLYIFNLTTVNRYQLSRRLRPISRQLRNNIPKVPKPLPFVKLDTLGPHLWRYKGELFCSCSICGFKRPGAEYHTFDSLYLPPIRVKMPSNIPVCIGCARNLHVALLYSFDRYDIEFDQVVFNEGMYAQLRYLDKRVAVAYIIVSRMFCLYSRLDPEETIERKLKYYFSWFHSFDDGRRPNAHLLELFLSKPILLKMFLLVIMCMRDPHGDHQKQIELTQELRREVKVCYE